MTAAEGQLLRWMEAGAENEAAEQAAIALLAETYSPTLYRVAFSILRNRVDAEDVVQETFLRVLRQKKTLDEIQDMRVWLVRIAWNLALDSKRRQRVASLEDDAAELIDSAPCGALSADASVSAAQGHAHILRAIDRLPRKEREALLLSAVEELTTAEIAAVQGTTESSVRSVLFRARQRLRERLKMKEGGQRK